MATYYWYSTGSGTWDNSAGVQANWFLGTGGTGGAAPNAPLATDTVIFNAASSTGTCNIASTAVCAVITLTGFTGTLGFGTTGKITLTAQSSTTVVTGDTTFSVTGTADPLIEISSGAFNILTTMGATTDPAKSLSISITGSGTKTCSGSYRNLTLTGAGTVASSTRTIYGNMTWPAAGAVGGSSAITTFAATSGTQTMTTNGILIDCAITINAPGATVQLADALSQGSGRAFVLTAGTFTTNNYTWTVGSFTGTGAVTRVLNLGSSLVTCLASGGSAWNCNAATNITVNPGTSTLFFSAVAAKSFFSAGQPYYNIKNAGGAANLTLNNTITLNELQADSLPCTYEMANGITVTLTNFPPSGTSAGAMFNMICTINGSVFTLSKASGTWNATNVYVRDCTFTGGATWTATNSADGGNNTGATILYTGVARYWTGGTGTWDTTSTANWSATNGGAAGASAPGPGDYAYFPSGTTGTVTLGANVTVSKWEVLGTPTFTFNFNGYKVITNWLGECFKTATGMTVNGTARVDMAYAGAWSVGPDSIRHGISNGTVLEANTISIYVTAGSATTGVPARLKTFDGTGFTGSLEAQFARTVFGNWIMHSGMTDPGGTAGTTFGATSGVQEIYCGGATFNCAVVFSGVGGTFRFMDAFTNNSSRNITLTSGILDANNYNVTIGTFTASGTLARTLTMGSGTWTITGVGASAFTLATTTNLTFNVGISTVLMTGATAKTFTGGNLTFYNLVQGGAGALTIVGNNAFNDLSVSYHPATITITAGSTQIFTNFSAAGILNDPLIINSTAGTYTFSKASGTVNASYLTLTNSIASGGATWNATYSTQTGCTNWNTTNLATTYYWRGGAGTWNNSDTTNWSLVSGDTVGGAGPPNINDIVIFNSSSGGGTCTIGANVNCRTLTMTGYTGVMAFGTNKISIGGAAATVYTGDTTYTTSGTTKLEFVYPGRTGTRTLVSSATTDPLYVMNIYITAGLDFVAFTTGHRWGTLNFTGSSVLVTNTTKTIYGSLILSATLQSMAGNQGQTLAGTGTHTIDFAGFTGFSHPITISGTGSYTLQSHFEITTYGVIQTFGTFDANGYNVTVSSFTSSNSNVRTLAMGSGTWTITGTGTAWSTNATTNLTYNRGTATILMTAATAKTFAGGGLTFWNISQGGAGALNITGSNTFNDIQNAYSATGATSILFTAGTITTVANFTAAGTAGNLLTIGSATAATHTLVKTGGNVSSDYLSISYSIVDASPAWYAGANSTNGGNNTNWNFSAPPAGGSSFFQQVLCLI